MTRTSRFLLAALVSLAAIAPLQTVHAQQAPYAQAELDQMLAPIALYPDALLSQILLAATRPLEVVEAARWSRANPGLQGDDAVRAAQGQSWDPSVKSLLAFPQLLARMDENLEWTKALGDAFFVQEPVVMETIQELRRRARAAGHLLPDERLRVYEDGQAIIIEPASPQFVYVPYYDPWLVYGPWWWPAYPPVAWAPWPGYVVARRPGVGTGFWWGPGVGISIGFMIGSVDWFHRRVHVPVHPGYSRPAIVHRDQPSSRRVAPQAVSPAPRIEPRMPLRAERPFPRREARTEAISPELSRAAPRSATVVDPSPRFSPRAPQTQPPALAAPAAPIRVERVPRAEALRAERPPPPTIQPQPAAPVRAERVPRAEAPRAEKAPPQANQPQPQRAERAPQAHPPAGPAARAEQASRTAPQRAEPASRHEGRDNREGLSRGGARP